MYNTISLLDNSLLTHIKIGENNALYCGWHWLKQQSDEALYYIDYENITYQVCSFQEMWDVDQSAPFSGLTNS